MLIDGEIPFEEAKALRFDYDTSYNVYSFPYMFYLDKGEHTLRLEVTIGEFSSIVQKMNDIVSALNKVYRSMLMLMGSSPDTKRDYLLDELMPEELSLLAEQTEKLEQLKNDYEKMTGQRGVQYQILKNAVHLLNRMCRRHDRIPRLFGSFGDTITSLGNWIVTARSQPLQVDYLLFDSPDLKKPEVSTSFFGELIFDLQKFYYSFVNDYSNTLENNDDNKITVWVSSGRDQSTALNQMILNQFTPKTGIPVNLQLVPAGTLLMAAVAGKGPDVALGNSQTDTINYAIRDAVVDLTTMEGYEQVRQRFHESACEPLSYRGAWYGVPETQTFFVRFTARIFWTSLS